MAKKKYDVIIVGGGPAGIGAAIGAGKKGANTLLIENQGFFGGIASFCLGMPINQMRSGSRERLYSNVTFSGGGHCGMCLIHCPQGTYAPQ